MFDASCLFAIEVQTLLFTMKCFNRERGASERVRTSPIIFATYLAYSKVQKITRAQERAAKKLLHSTPSGRRPEAFQNSMAKLRSRS